MTICQNMPVDGRRMVAKLGIARTQPESAKTCISSPSARSSVSLTLSPTLFRCTAAPTSMSQTKVFHLVCLRPSDNPISSSNLAFHYPAKAKCRADRARSCIPSLLQAVQFSKHGTLDSLTAFVHGWPNMQTSLSSA